jgi:hypothetical protein
MNAPLRIGNDALDAVIAAVGSALRDGTFE